MKYLNCLLYCLFSFMAFSQNLSSQVSLLPAKPGAGQKVQVIYQAQPSVSSTKLFCYLYQNSDQPRVTVLPFRQNNKRYEASFVVDNEVKSFMMVVYDSLGVVDNNNGEGYWSPVYENEKPVADAWASIADMYASWRNNVYTIDKKHDVALKLYQQEFIRNAYLKRKHMLFYLFAVQGTGSFSKSEYKRELEGFTLFDDLTEVELRFLARFFAEIKENSKAKELNLLRLRKYPEDGNVLEEGSGVFQQEFNKEKSFAKKKEMYDAFCARFADLKNNEAIRRTQFKKALLLCKMAVYYLKEDIVDDWEAELAKLNEESRRSALHLASCDLRDKDAYPDKAEIFARRACELELQQLNRERVADFRNPPDLTDEQVRYYKHKAASWTFHNYGLVLMMNNKMEMATSVLREAAITYGHSELSDINDDYINCLVKSGQHDLAQKEAAGFSKSQKSSPYIDSILKQTGKSDSLYQSVDLSNSKNLVPVNLINEPLSFFDFVDAEGKPVTKEALKGKIVIVDCWATWCGSCIAGFGGMYSLTKKYESNTNVLFLFLDTAEFGSNTVEKARKLIKSKNYDFNLVFDHENMAQDKLGVNSLPTKLIIDQNGNIRYKQIGEISGNIEKLDSVIKQLMK